MSNIDLLAIISRFPPQCPEASWFTYYWRDASQSISSSAKTTIGKLGRMRFTSPPEDTRALTRQVYEKTSCRIYTQPQYPLLKDYYVCANVASATSGVDKFWLANESGYEVPTNVSLINITPTSITTPLRQLVYR